jgi:hypothetical protein
MKKDDINATLVAIAHRVGPKASEKKWVLFDDET